MEWLIGFTVLLLLAVLAVLFVILRRMQAGDAGKTDTQSMLLLQNQIQDLTRTVEAKIGEGTKTMFESVRTQFTESQRILRDVTQELTTMKETGKQMLGSMDKLEELQQMLKNPKSRGVLGEYYLETLLKNVLPAGSYEMQYRMGKNDEGEDLIVDAAVFVKDKVIPVDSKFSLENYNRVAESKDPAEREKLEKLFVNDLKNRIVETSKYIQPQKGTMDFAFMFIPHEAIYYDLLVNKIGALRDDTENLIQRAASKYRVIIVSPTSFLAYLQTVLQGLKALQIEEKVGEVITRVGELSKHLKSYEDYHQKLGNALSTTINHYNASGKEFKKIDKDVLRITGAAIGVEVAALDRPNREEE